jgi:hypothetical protein
MWPAFRNTRQYPMTMHFFAQPAGAPDWFHYRFKPLPEEGGR